MPYSAIRPRRTNEVVNLAPAAANRTSQNNAWVSPMPAQAPLIAAITGLLTVVTNSGCRSPTILVRSASPALSTLAELIDDRSPISAPRAEGPPAAGHHDRADIRVGLCGVHARVEAGGQATAPSRSSGRDG